MQDELFQFKLQKVWRLVDSPKGKYTIGTKWIYINKNDKRGIVVRNKAIRVAQGYTQEEAIDYDKVFDLVSRIEAIRDGISNEFGVKIGSELKLVPNGYLDWNEMAANDEIHVSDVGLTYYCKCLGLCSLGFGLTFAGLAKQYGWIW
nr:ribonuclease H-like domain, reverse transcriptase, RNA-dependent DNA polymerase [Tanacetum cinerariifolium]